MADADKAFRYAAVDGQGRRISGSVRAQSEARAFERLRRDGYSPISIRPERPSRTSSNTTAKSLKDREAAQFLADLSALLQAGADIRAALSVLAERAAGPHVRSVARQLAADIAGGAALDRTFSTHLGGGHAFVGALVAAGEASGDLPGGLARAAEMLQSKIRMGDQLVSALSYPLFVLGSTIVAIGVILLFIVPSLAPLVDSPGTPRPFTLDLLIQASNFLHRNLLLLSLGLVALLVLALLAGVFGLATAPIERLWLDGPARRSAAGLTFGAFAIALGNMLSAGTPMTEALRLSTRSVQSGTARRRLEAVGQAVRQGLPLSGAFDQVKAFPPSISRLAAIGEASGALGVMLSRAGKLEEDAAIRRIEAAGRLLGPTLIVILGALVGLLMAGLLSGVSQLGATALN